MKYKVLLISGFICWGAPLLSATIVLFAYWQTHAEFLLGDGFLLQVAGFILGLVGTRVGGQDSDGFKKSG